MSLKNWKAGAAARIQAAKTRGVAAVYPSKQVDVGNKLTTKLADSMMELCEKYGIADNNERVHCTSEILQETSRHFRRIQQAQKATDEILTQFCDGLKAIMAKYGISSVEKQESFILEYLEHIERVS